MKESHLDTLVLVMTIAVIYICMHFFNVDFELILTSAVLATGLVVLVGNRSVVKVSQPISFLVDYSKSFFPVLLVVLVLRSFLGEAFRVPSGSLEPTLTLNEFILVNKFAYGLRLPVTRTKIFEVALPERGDVAVFRYPPNPKLYYVKRIVGIPGDKLSYVDKVLYVNGERAKQIFQGYGLDSTTYCMTERMREDLTGVKHDIYLCGMQPSNNFRVTVPKGVYFGMGDNRDDSLDSRNWGFIPEKNLVGRPNYILFSWAGMNSFSWNDLKHVVRWDRIGRKIR